MKAFSDANDLLFVTSVGPGYNDERIRPWNKKNTKARRNGAYYGEMWREAVNVDPDAISITSFNEWGEGTQIEPATPKIVPPNLITNPRTGKRDAEGAHVYLDYGSDPNYYLILTSNWVKTFERMNKDEL